MKLAKWQMDPDINGDVDPYEFFDRVYSYSQIEAFRRCEAFYRHSWVRKIELRRRQSFFIWGEAYHAFLENWYAHKNLDLSLKAIHDVFMNVDMSMATADEVDKMRVQQAQVEGVAEAYPHIFKDDDFAEVMPEQQFFVEVKGGERTIGYTGKIDMLVKDEEGKWWVFETKTGAYGTVNADYYKTLGFDGQIVGYSVLAELALGIKIHGIMYNIIQKPLIRPKKRPPETLAEYRKRVKEEYTINAAGKEYMIRYPFLVPDYIKKEWLTELLHSIELLDRKWQSESKVWPKTTSACKSKWGVCHYAEACNAGANSNPRSYNKIIYKKKPPREPRR